MVQLVVNENDAGQRFDKFLAKYLDAAPKSFLYKMLRKKNIVLNGKKADGSEKLTREDVVCFYLSDETIQKFRMEKAPPSCAWNFQVLYEDAHILLVDKPAGILAQKAEQADISLNEMILSYLVAENKLSKEDMDRFTPSVCNRLDRNTSGIIAAGKSLSGLQALSKLFRERQIRRFYICLVSGQMTMKKKVDAYITKDTEKNLVSIKPLSAFKAGEDAEAYDLIETVYEPAAVFRDYTLLRVELVSGKTHQIRAHLAFMGHPVIGDYKYGSRNKNQIFKKAFGLDRQLLHAESLLFPKTDGALEAVSEKSFSVEAPALFREIVSALEAGGDL